MSRKVIYFFFLTSYFVGASIVGGKTESGLVQFSFIVRVGQYVGFVYKL